MKVEEKIAKINFLKRVSLESFEVSIYVENFFNNIEVEVYNSAAIEGNRVSLGDTKKILEGDQLVDYTVAEQQEIINLAKAYELMYREYKGKALSTDMVLELHRVIMKDRPYMAGAIRTVNVTASGHKSKKPIYSPFECVWVELCLMVESYYAKGYSPLERVSNLKCDFIQTHPFEDGNGRESRLLLNFALVSHGYIPITIRLEDRDNYISVLERCREERDNKYFLEYICDIVLEEYKKLLTD